jgi:hypothetical protein
VKLHVFVKNLGDGSGTSEQSNRYCVKAKWAQDGSIVASKEGCNDEELRRDHVGVVEIFAAHVPREGRVEIRLEMAKEDCPDCYQDESDGEWILLSP